MPAVEADRGLFVLFEALAGACGDADAGAGVGAGAGGGGGGRSASSLAC